VDDANHRTSVGPLPALLIHRPRHWGLLFSMDTTPSATETTESDLDLRIAWEIDNAAAEVDNQDYAVQAFIRLSDTNFNPRLAAVAMIEERKVLVLDFGEEYEGTIKGVILGGDRYHWYILFRDDAGRERRILCHRPPKAPEESAD
jgi:hypothetical protein